MKWRFWGAALAILMLAACKEPTAPRIPEPEDEEDEDPPSPGLVVSVVFDAPVPLIFG